MLPAKRANRPTNLKDPSKIHAPRQEKRLAGVLGGRVTNGSGNQAEKGDVRVKGVIRLEAKCTRRKSFSVTREMVDKIEDAAAGCASEELPVIHVEFLTPSGDREKGLYIMREADVERLIVELLHAKSDESLTTARAKHTPTKLEPPNIRRRK